MKTSIVIPAHNESKRIINVIKGICKVNKIIKIIVVDDGSTDTTSLKLRIASNTCNNLVVLRHKVNLGKGAAMRTGAMYAFKNGADSVIFMDADGQHAPDDLSKFQNKLNEDKYGLILGVREKAKDIPFIRSYGNKFGILVIYMLFGIKVSDLLCGYRAITKKAFKKLNLESSGYGIETEMVAKMALHKLKYTQVVVKTVYHDKVKGVTILDAVRILFDVIRWRISI